MPHGDALTRQVGLEKKVMARTADLKFELTGVRSGGRPQNLTLNSQLPHNLARLAEVTFHLRPGSRDSPLIIRVFAVAPGLRKAPGRMVQQQAAEGEEPEEEEQKQARIKMQLAIPAPAAGP